MNKKQSGILKPIYEYKSALKKSDSIKDNFTVDLSGRRILLAEDVEVNAEKDVQRSLQSGMNAHLSKPVEPERFIKPWKN